jgi:hypothetical protein
VQSTSVGTKLGTAVAGALEDAWSTRGTDSINSVNSLSSSETRWIEPMIPARLSSLSSRFLQWAFSPPGVQNQSEASLIAAPTNKSATSAAMRAARTDQKIVLPKTECHATPLTWVIF